MVKVKSYIFINIEYKRISLPIIKLYYLENNTKYNIENLKYTDIAIKDNIIKVVGPYKALGFIDTTYQVDLTPKIINNNLTITLNNFKIGKIKISDSILKKGISEYKDKLPFEVNENVITVDKSFTEPITLNDVNIKDDNVILKVEIRINNLIDFIKDYNVQITL